MVKTINTRVNGREQRVLHQLKRRVKGVRKSVEHGVKALIRDQSYDITPDGAMALFQAALEHEHDQWFNASEDVVVIDDDENVAAANNIPAAATIDVNDVDDNSDVEIITNNDNVENK